MRRSFCCMELAVVVVMVVVQWCDAAQSGRQVTEVCNGLRRLGSCSTVGEALSVLLGRPEERGAEREGALVKPPRGGTVCSGTCCSPGLQEDLAKAARNEFHSVFADQLRDLLPHCHAMEPAVLRRDISNVLSEYITFQTQLISSSICPINTLAYGFEEFASSIARDDLLVYTKEQIVRLYFNVMVDYFNYRIQNPHHYECVRMYVVDTFGEQIDHYTKQVVVFLAKLQLLLKTSQEMSTLYWYLSSTSEWLSSSCVGKLTTMTYCRICSGYVCFKPCRPFCMDTTEGCLTSVTAMLRMSLQDTLELLQVIREDMHNNTGALLRLAYHIHEEYLPSLEENTMEMNSKLRQCHYGKRTGQGVGKEGTPVGSTSGPQCHSAYKKLPPHEPNLEAQLDEITMRWFDCFSGTLPSVTTLARDVCLGEEFSGREYQEWNCWNGTHLGRFSKQAEVPVEERDVFLTEKQTTLSLALWRAARALEALNNCTTSTQCITAYAQSLKLTPMRNSSPKVADMEENEITSPASTHRWDKPPQLVLRYTNPSLPSNDPTSGTASTPVTPVTSSGEIAVSKVCSSGQCVFTSMCPWWLMLVLTISVHFL